MSAKKIPFILLLLPALCAPALPLDPESPHMAKRLENEAAAAKWTEGRPQNADTKTWPGVHADKHARTVAVLAESTGLAADTIIEFPLASLVSNHDYESFALMLGKPSHLAEAVEWMGMKRGEPVSRRAARFWPKGERMSVTVAKLEGGGAATPIGEWIVDRQAGAPAFTNHFVYTGSVWNDKNECAADGEAPGAVLTTYNEYRSLFDIPGRADKGGVYGSYANTDRLDKGELLVFTFKMEKPRVVEMSVTAKPGDAMPLEIKQYRFTDSPVFPEVFHLYKFQVDTMLNENSLNMEKFIKAAQTLLTSGQPCDAFTQWSFDDALTVEAAAKIAAAIGAIEGDSGIRVDGPPPGQLYYRAFLPNPAWIPREERLVQPFELHLSRDADGGWKRVFVSIDEDWSAPNKITPDLTVNEHPLGDDWKTALPKIIEEKDLENHRSALFIFAPPDTPLSAFMPYARHVHPRLYETHVFGAAFPE